MNDGKLMNDYKIEVYLKNQIVFSKEVRGKDRGRAITNVLTNLYRGDVDYVKAIELPIINKWVCYRGCTWETQSEDTPTVCPNCGAKDVEKNEEWR